MTAGDETLREHIHVVLDTTGILLQHEAHIRDLEHVAQIRNRDVESEREGRMEGGSSGAKEWNTLDRLDSPGRRSQTPCRSSADLLPELQRVSLRSSHRQRHTPNRP